MSDISRRYDPKQFRIGYGLLNAVFESVDGFPEDQRTELKILVFTGLEAMKRMYDAAYAPLCDNGRTEAAYSSDTQLRRDLQRLDRLGEEITRFLREPEDQ
ncbi:hypothetical protein COV20_04800 [Candidatus Woesearchaeota archaeon CG10_big_fil_rev_8_21_14_0_10_45_16]|nr:MAG: hypothetical protein COV20_04800 [Candidatus Woesearchaeota archaeon CG10_big_fil_rev_8_21_14_0_10_45_16]